MKAEDLKNSILQLAMEGKLVPQDPNDEPASVLLDRISEEKEKLIKEKKIKRNNKESFIFRKNGHFYEKVGKKGEPVCIDEEIPFDVPANWELCRLENLCSLLNPKIGEHGKYPYLNAKFLRNKTDPEIKEKGRFIQINTKVILVDGENSGEVFLTHEDGYMGSTFRLLDINSQIFDKYILKLIELWRNPLKKSKKGAAIPHLNKDIFNNIFVGIPPLNEQKRIVNQINSLMPLIIEYGDYKEKLDKLNSEFPDKLKSSILQEAIQGKLVPQNPNDEPASVLLERIKNEKERLIKEKKIKRNKNESFIYKRNNNFYEQIGKKSNPVCIDDEIPFDIPYNWEWIKLNNICNYGNFLSIDSENIADNDWVLDLKDIEKNTGRLIKFTVKKEIKSKSKKFIFKKGDVLYSKLRPYLNKVIIAKQDGYCTTEILPLKFYNSVYNYYAQIVLMSPYFVNYAVKSSYGTKMPRLGTSDGKNAFFPLPPLNEQKEIVNKVNECFTTIDNFNK